MIDPIINTKLHRPPVDRNYVHRPHLIAQLDNYRGKALTLVSAAAGYGKSSLISSWLETYENPGALLSLSENDSDLRTFASYFIAAVHKHFPEACQKTQAFLKNIDLPPLEDLGTSLLNELDQIKQPFILVLDDYYLIKEIAVHKLIATILKHPPQFFHLVIVGRHDPPLPIPSLRARSQLIEIRTEDLCFSAAETETLLNRLLGIQIDASIAAAVAKKTEGWVTGLRLAALSMRQRTDIDPKLLEPHVDAQFVMEYLFTEVFSHQPLDISLYLLGTAVLDRFCGPLCEAVYGPGAEPFTCEMSGWEFISWLNKENIFVIPLDPEKRWFRYHHLFQKLLINQLNRRSSAEEIKALHAKAGAWLAENGIIEEAVRHYLGADDIPVAIQLVARHGHNLMNNQQWPDLERLIGMIPRDHVEQEAAMNGTTVHCGNFLLHLQERAGCDAPVLIKEPAYERPTRSYCDQLHNEYDITQQLTDVAGVRPVYAIEGTESQPVVLMEYIQGRSLAELIRADSLDLAEKLQLAVNVTAVLSRIHEHQVMHKDMSSSNILVADKDEPGSQGGVYVIDFGIASVMQQKSVSHPATDDTLVGIIERIEPLAPDTAKGLRTLLGNFQIGLISDLLGENNEQ